MSETTPREAGEQQFVAKRWPRLTCACCPGACRFDSGLRWDHDRKRVVSPPPRKAVPR